MKSKIKKTTHTNYTITLDVLTSVNGNEWIVRQQDTTKKIGNYLTFKWHIVRRKDGLCLSTHFLNNDSVSLYDAKVNRENILSEINNKELLNK